MVKMRVRGHMAALHFVMVCQSSREMFALPLTDLHCISHLSHLADTYSDLQVHEFLNN